MLHNGSLRTLFDVSSPISPQQLRKRAYLSASCRPIAFYRLELDPGHRVTQREAESPQEGGSLPQNPGRCRTLSLLPQAALVEVTKRSLGSHVQCERV